MLPGNSEKQSMNDVRQREGCLAATGWKTDWRHTASDAVCWSKICIHRERLKFQLQCLSIFTGWKYLCRIFSLFPEIFFFKDRIEEITRFVAAVNNFPWEIN